MKRNNFVCIFGLVPILLGSFVWIKPSFAITPQIEAGGSHTIAVKSDGTLWTRGDNGAGQLGDGTNSDRDIPVQVFANSTDWVRAWAGGGHTVAFKADGTLWAWGNKINRSLAQAHFLGQPVPF